MFFEIDFTSDVAIFEQLRRAIIIGLAQKDLSPGQKLPSVREMAENIGINLHTVNKAYKLLESDGLIIMDRRFGSLISEEIYPMKDFDSKKLDYDIDLLISIARLKGTSKTDFLKMIDDKWEEKNE